MEILFVLVPVSVLLVLTMIAVFAWAMNSGQFEDVEREGLRILEDDAAPPRAAGVQDSVMVDADQEGGSSRPQ